jgi:hypothetical protein
MSCKWISNDKKSEISEKKRLLKNYQMIDKNNDKNINLMYDILQNESSKIKLSKNAAKKLKKKNLNKNFNLKGGTVRQRLNVSRSED